MAGTRWKPCARCVRYTPSIFRPGTCQIRTGNFTPFPAARRALFREPSGQQATYLSRRAIKGGKVACSALIHCIQRHGRDGAGGGIRTHTGGLLRPVPLPLGYAGVW
jgi:hypothetical protein